MIDPVTGGPHTYHTTNPVPFILVERRRPSRSCNPAARCETLLPPCSASLAFAEPGEMTGRDLRKNQKISYRVPYG